MDEILHSLHPQRTALKEPEDILIGNADNDVDDSFNDEGNSPISIPTFFSAN